MPLPVVAIITAKPGSESIVSEALLSLVAPTREEEGCLSYELFRAADDPAVFVTVEQWREQADLDAHMQTPHVAAALDAAGEHLTAPPVIRPLQSVET